MAASSTTFQINGLVTTSSADRLAWALASVRGVGSAHVDAKTGTVILKRRRGMDPDLTRAHAVVRSSGFEVSSPQESQAWPRHHEWIRQGWLATPDAHRVV
jgi:hypothetical protein